MIHSDDIPENLEGFTLYKGTEVANGTNATTTTVITDTHGEWFSFINSFIN